MLDTWWRPLVALICNAKNRHILIVFLFFQGQSTVSSLNATFNIGQLETPSGSTCDSTAMDTTPTGRPSPKRVLAELNAERDSIEDFRDTKGLFQPPTVESSSGGGIKTFDKSKRKRTLLPTSGFFKSPLLPS